MLTQSSARIVRYRLLPRHRRFSRSVFTKDQIKTAELQKTPHTPNQVVTEVPHSPEPSMIDVPSPLWYYRMGPVKDFFGWFSRMQRRRPLGTAAATSVTTYLCGDLLAQEVGGEPYDALRTLRMMAIGGVACIPGYKWWVSSKPQTIGCGDNSLRNLQVHVPRQPLQLCVQVDIYHGQGSDTTILLRSHLQYLLFRRPGHFVWRTSLRHPPPCG